jgi:hypothetical protein
MDNKQEQALTQYCRRIWAKRLRKERELYRAGLGDIIALNGNYNFIKRLAVTHFYHEGAICFDDLQKEVIAAREGACSYSTIPDIALDADTEIDSSERFVDSTVTVAVQSHRYTFSKLDRVKSTIRSNINYMLRDAAWKIDHQPSGKDTRWYLGIIQKELNK